MGLAPALGRQNAHDEVYAACRRLKRDSYKDYIVRHPVEFTGFKLFYHNDTKKGDPLMTPRDVLGLWPQPLYIQYQ